MLKSKLIDMLEISQQAPIILFVYNRPNHTKQTIEALQKNVLANESLLFIYSDGPKENEDSIDRVDEVRKYINSIAGFKSVKVVESDSNLGLSKSIIDGVTNVINEYGRAIVVEDDIVTSPYFLTFMNEALEFYREQKQVWHISGWNYPISCSHCEETFLWRVMNCWGWATWSDRWVHFEKDSPKLIREWSKADIRRFNLDGAANFWGQVIANHKGKTNTWAVFWYATIFERNGLCLNPVQTLVDNIGHDGEGEHCGNVKIYIDKLNHASSFNFPTILTESSKYLEQIRSYLHIPFIQKIKNRFM